MERGLRVVVGLGNPDQKYRGTRHNIGRDYIEHLASENRESFHSKRQAEFFRLALFSDAPTTFARLTCYMNESGPAIQGLLMAENARPEQMLIIVDDFMIPWGTFRLRPEGSSGGHNGLKSVIETFGSDAFPRLRVGVGPVDAGVDPADFVLNRFKPAERDQVGKIYEALSASLKTIFSSDLQHAMSAVNKAHI